MTDTHSMARKYEDQMKEEKAAKEAMEVKVEEMRKQLEFRSVRVAPWQHANSNCGTTWRFSLGAESH